MTDTEPDAPVAPPAGVPPEEAVIEEGFDVNTWLVRLKAGKYDGHLVEMCAHMNQRAITENRRRWRVTFRDQTFTEENVSGEVADEAERFASMGWGYMNALLGENVMANMRPARAVLWGICKAELRMTDANARRAIQMPAQDVLDCFEYYEVDPPAEGEAGKDEPLR